jgi:lipopolysaccharide/colanic/teichoic acid biosynthesis glycosyltransferase
MKRTFDLVAACLGLMVASPFLLVAVLAIWVQDFRSPFYIAPRVGLHGRLFPMFKLRSMVVDADKSGVSSTSAGDLRITPIGQVIRRYKLDELVQLWNVVRGDLSLVGPRPDVASEVALYTEEEKRLLNVRPGITDMASIVFSDEGDILKGREDPDRAYRELIGPWKHELALFYIDKRSMSVDLQIIWLTCVAIVSRRRALEGIGKILSSLGAREELKAAAARNSALLPSYAPGYGGHSVARPIIAASKQS